MIFVNPFSREVPCTKRNIYKLLKIIERDGLIQRSHRAYDCSQYEKCLDSACQSDILLYGIYSNFCMCCDRYTPVTLSERIDEWGPK